MFTSWDKRNANAIQNVNKLEKKVPQSSNQINVGSSGQVKEEIFFLPEDFFNFLTYSYT